LIENAGEPWKCAAVSDDRPVLFEVATPLGFRVRTSPEYWAKVVSKHPDLAGGLEMVKQTLADPDEIRRSSRDEKILLCYRVGGRHWIVAVARRRNGDGYLVTAYRTDALKEGESVWHK
jgi:hypothetical protein